MNYFTKCFSTYSFRGLIWYGSSFLRKEADQNVVWGGLISLPFFFCVVPPAFAVGGYHLWENVHSSGKQQLTDRGTGTSTGAVLAGSTGYLTEELPEIPPSCAINMHAESDKILINVQYQSVIKQHLL